MVVILGVVVLPAQCEDESGGCDEGGEVAEEGGKPSVHEDDMSDEERRKKCDHNKRWS